MFVHGIAARPASTVVALCEPNPIRATFYNNLLVSLGAKAVPVYKPEQFLNMLKTESVETIVICCIDALHDVYIVPALEAGSKLSSNHPEPKIV